MDGVAVIYGHLNLCLNLARFYQWFTDFMAVEVSYRILKTWLMCCASCLEAMLSKMFDLLLLFNG